MEATTKRALVTGATSGIGRAVAVALAGAGHEVTATGRNQVALDELSSIAGVTPVELDFADQRGVDALLDDADLDVLVNNAGTIPPMVPFHELGAADIDATLDVNLRATLTMTRLALPAMVRRRSGHVFFVGSIAGHAPYPNMAMYGATKAAISSLAASLRCDLVGSGVRITEIVAGRVQTDLYRDVLDDNARAAMYDGIEVVQPIDVADMLLAVLAMPSHVDVSRFDILPNAQFVGGGDVRQRGE